MSVSIKKLFHEYNQELMQEFYSPVPPRPTNPMMGYGGIPAYQYGGMMPQKPIPFPKKNDDSSDWFWKALLGAGAVAGLGTLGVMGHQHFYGGKNQIGRAGGDLIAKGMNLFGDTGLKMSLDAFNNFVNSKVAKQQEREHEKEVFNSKPSSKNSNNSSSNNTSKP